jgi:TonB family protein
MFRDLTRRPPILPALLISCLLLVSSAAAQDKKPAPGTGEGVGSGVAPDPWEPLPKGADPGRPFWPSEVTNRAVITYKPEPGFTEEARENDVQGNVRLRVVLNVSGEVTNVIVISSLPYGLTEKAIAAAKEIRFTPARHYDRPVSQYLILQYFFDVFYEESEVERKAVILEQPEPQYPLAAHAAGAEGKVVLDVLLHGGGWARVKGVVGEQPRGLTESAVEAAERIRFTPAKHKGRPVTVIRRIEYVFSLK